MQTTEARSFKGLTFSKLTPVDQEATVIVESFDSLHEEPVGKRMESTSPSVPFPLLANPGAYDPITIPLRGSADSEKELTKAEETWVDVFRRSIPSFKKQAESDSSVENAADLAEKFAERYGSLLDDFAKDPSCHGGPPTPIVLARLRELCLREVGFQDIFQKTKEEENDAAVELLPAVLAKVDAVDDIKERLELLLKGVLAGNIFDLGAQSARDAIAGGVGTFESSFQQLLPRPWVMDDVEAFQLAWQEKSWKKVVIFCDNSGADIVLGVLPLAREFVRAGAQVVLAANDAPAINDITYFELLSLVQKVQVKIEDETVSKGIDSGRLLIVNSGSDIPLVDLSAVSPELAYAAEDAELVVLEGMGRGIESNLNAQFTCDSLNIGMVKHAEVAEFLKGRLYDCVVKYKAVDYVPTPSRARKTPSAFLGTS